MNVGILLLLLILAYAGWVISRKIKKSVPVNSAIAGIAAVAAEMEPASAMGKAITGSGYNKEQLL